MKDLLWSSLLQTLQNMEFIQQRIKSCIFHWNCLSFSRRTGRLQIFLCTFRAWKMSLARRAQAPGRVCGGQGVCRGPAGTEFWPFAVPCCDTRTAEVDFVSRSTRCLLKMPFKTPQSKWREWLPKKLGKLDDLNRIVTPLVEHLSPISASGFLRVYVLVRDVISTAARDAKRKIKCQISKDTRG